MKILVFGKSGQVASELQALAPVVALGRYDADFQRPEQLCAIVQRERPDAVINAAAYTAVDRAEQDELVASKVNGIAPAVLASVCAELDIPFVHISTDYVFDGHGNEPWKPDDPTSPMSVYGRTKLAGEQGVAAAGGRYVLLRTSWVFSIHGNNFVKTMLRLGLERDRLNIVADQIGGPTPARDIASACLAIVDQLIVDASKSGTYHFSGAPDVSWAGFARDIFRQAGISCEVVDIPTTEYPVPAQRPHNSRLDCSTIDAVFGIQQPNWQAGLRTVLDKLTLRNTQ